MPRFWTFRCKFIKKFMKFKRQKESGKTYVINYFNVSTIQLLNSQCFFFPYPSSHAFNHMLSLLYSPSHTVDFSIFFNTLQFVVFSGLIHTVCFKDEISTKMRHMKSFVLSKRILTMKLESNMEENKCL